MARRRPAIFSRGALLAVALAVGAVALVVYQATNQASSGDAALRAGDDSAAKIGQAATGPARAGEGVLHRLSEMWNATQRIEELEAANRDAQAWRDLAERLAERNARYEALLRMPADSFGEGVNVEDAIAAQLVLDSGGPFTRTLVANAGHDHGVRVGYIALNENGLIGRVVSVGRRSSRVLMLDDYNSRIPVMGVSSRVRAVLAGQATQPPELITHPYQLQAPRMDFIVGAQNLREGERVITSGDGGIFPRGISVGVAQRQPDGSWRVALAASQRPIDFVRLAPFVGVENPESAPVVDPGPPLAAASSVSTVVRDLTPPTPAAPSALTAPRPRPPVAAPAQAEAEAPAPDTQQQPPPTTPEGPQ
ncbi:MAG: rod shape-determining protein MreC [Hyphomonadaceae bacterium]|nr:rod shape-determining protein MreC [Hyphomonadaceae bacterium]